MSTEQSDRAPMLRYAGRYSARALDLVATMACGASMVLVAVRAGASAAATGMAAMSGTAPGAPQGLLGALLRTGPWLLVASVLLVTAAIGLTRRPATAILALLVGTLLYAGMYAHPDLTVMYAAIAVGYTAWAVLYLWVRRARPTQPDAPATVRAERCHVLGDNAGTLLLPAPAHRRRLRRACIRSDRTVVIDADRYAPSDSVHQCGPKSCPLRRTFPEPAAARLRRPAAQRVRSKHA